MSINMSNDKNIPTDTEAYYETVASQEEIYREETEEEVRAILTSDDRSPGENLIRGRQRSMLDSNNNACIAESLDEQPNHAAFVPPLP